MKKINSFDDVVSLVLNTPSDCKFANSVKEAKTLKQIKKLEIGQVWRVKLDNEGNAFSAVLTKLPEKKLNTADEYIEMVPLYVSPFDEDIDKETDILVDAVDMPNGLPSLPEWWNKVSAFVTDLDKCYGKLENNTLSNLLDRLTNQPEAINLSKSGKMFRKKEIKEYSDFSERILNLNFSNPISIIEFVVDKNSFTSSKESIYEEEHLDNGWDWGKFVPIMIQSNEQCALAAASSKIYEELVTALEKLPIDINLVNKEQNLLLTPDKGYKLTLKLFSKRKPTEYSSEEDGTIEIPISELDNALKFRIIFNKI